MKILVVGGGGREHALVWKISRSPLASEIYAAPGNAGIEELARCVPIMATDIDGLLEFARRESIDLTVVGPELPLEKGIVDRFQGAGLRIFGPSKEAARLESSKVYAKEFMVRQCIPTAEHQVFHSPQKARQYIEQRSAPIVIKADGLAAGKGSIVVKTVEAAHQAIHQIMEEKAFGSAGDRIVVEEFLEGEEASILALVDGKSFLTMIPSQDHKPIFDGDRGPNTGGMGAYAPAPVITEALMAQIQERVLKPVVVGMARAGHPYKGILYAGLMVTAKGLRVVEFNCRFGDPETQAVVPLLKGDLVDLMLAACDGTLQEREAQWSSGAAVCVVMASGGYPGSYRRGIEIHGLDRFPLENVLLFHAGTKREGSTVMTDGGRVLGVTGLGADVHQAVQRAYRAAEGITFQGAYYRTDIAHRALVRDGLFPTQCQTGSAGVRQHRGHAGNGTHPSSRC